MAVALALGGAIVFSSSPAFAAPTLTATPADNLVELQTVAVDGTGFAASVQVGVCQGVDDGAPDPGDCSGGAFALLTTSSAGEFSSTLTVRRFIYVPSLGRSVDCLSESCAIGAAEANNIVGTATFAPITFAPPPPPPATPGSIAFTPEAPHDAEEITVAGSGFRPGARVEILQCVADLEDPTDCNSEVTSTDADANGDFSTTFVVSQDVNSPSGSTVACGTPGACVIAAAEVVDITGTIVTTPLDIATLQPDGQIRRLSDGAITGDDIYDPGGVGQSRRRGVPAGTSWSFALQVENDGEVADDIVVTGPPGSPEVTVRYFVGYYDVTTFVTGSGITFTDVDPGEIRKLAVKFTMDATAPAGSGSGGLVIFSSAIAPRFDAVGLSIFVPAAP